MSVKRPSARAAAGVFAAGLFAFAVVCGPAFADDIRFLPPFNWDRLPNGQPGPYPGLVGTWMAPPDSQSSFRENINVRRYPTAGSIGGTVDSNLRALETQDPATIVLARKANARCRPDTSQVVLFSTELDGHQLVIEQVYTVARGALFVATLTREATQPVFDNARKAIENMCSAHSRKQN
jgi:hypothetical protein